MPYRPSPAIALLLLTFVAGSVRWCAAAPLVTEPGVITGTVIFEDGPPPTTAPSTRPATQPVTRTAAVSLLVGKTVEYTGRVLRDAGGSWAYDLNVAVINPKDLVRKKTVGKWTGWVPFDAAAGYDVADAGKDPSRIAVDAIDAAGKPQRFADAFAGRITARDGEMATFARYVAGKPVLWTVAKLRDVRLRSVVLAMGPVPLYARTPVGGRIGFDLASGDVFVDDVAFETLVNAKPVRDVLSGTVRRRVEPPNATTAPDASPATTQAADAVVYDVNLRLGNVPTTRPARGTSGHNPAFFAIDPAAPGLSGEVFVSRERLPSGGVRQTMTFRINAAALTKPQVAAVFKLALLCLGPAAG